MDGWSRLQGVSWMRQGDPGRVPCFTKGTQVLPCQLAGDSDSADPTNMSWRLKKKVSVTHPPQGLGEPKRSQNHGSEYGRLYFSANFHFWKQKILSLNMLSDGKVKKRVGSLWIYQTGKMLGLMEMIGLKGLEKRNFSVWGVLTSFCGEIWRQAVRRAMLREYRLLGLNAGKGQRWKQNRRLWSSARVLAWISLTLEHSRDYGGKAAGEAQEAYRTNESRWGAVCSLFIGPFCRMAPLSPTGISFLGNTGKSLFLLLTCCLYFVEIQFYSRNSVYSSNLFMLWTLNQSEFPGRSLPAASRTVRRFAFRGTEPRGTLHTRYDWLCVQMLCVWDLPRKSP